MNYYYIGKKFNKITSFFNLGNSKSNTFVGFYLNLSYNGCFIELE